MANRLSATKIAGFKRRLQDRSAELRGQIRQELLASDEQRFIDLAGQVHDAEEASVADLLVDLNLASIDRHAQELRAIDAALQRIAAGDYGNCIDCGAPIPVERLEANPTALRDVECQTRYEKTHATEERPSL